MSRSPRDPEGSWRNDAGLVFAVATAILLGLAAVLAAVLAFAPAPETRETSLMHLARTARASGVAGYESAATHRRSLFDERRVRHEAGGESQGVRHNAGPVSSRP
jgi:hypothetical protein